MSIDEFKLHNEYKKYATHIIDAETGHILWIRHGKKKQVVYDFIDSVGLDWMASAEAIACDINSDFQEAFKEKCPHIQIVFDYFHIVKNLNDKVINEVCKDEQKRLISEGNFNATKLLKKTNIFYVLQETNYKKRIKKHEMENLFQKQVSFLSMNLLQEKKDMKANMMNQ